MRITPMMLAVALAAPSFAAEPAKEEQATVHINSLRNPELKSYRAIVAGLDKFDQLHALAPAVPQLRFEFSGKRKLVDGQLPVARIAADDFSIPLALDGDGRFAVPRSEAAYDAKAELVLNRKKYEVRVEPHVRTPGLPDNQFRMGDVRLDCQVKVAIAKEEIPFWANGLINTFMLTTDWCSWFKGETPKGGDRSWPQKSDAKLSAATLRDGERSLALKVKGKDLRIPIGDTSWSNDAIVEVEFAPPDEPAPEPSAPSAPL